MQATPLLDVRMRLGESILWNDRTQELLWVDVGYPSYFYRHHEVAGTLQRAEHDGVISAIALTEDDDVLLLLTDTGLKLCRLSTGNIANFRALDAEPVGNRCNDCGVDPQGRLWFGTMENNLTRDGTGRSIGRRGRLYCFDGVELRQHLSGLGIPNTLVWSPDAGRFYLADSLDSTIYTYQCNGDSISNRTVFARPATPGVPDGSAIDRAGNLWNCRWGDAAIFVFDSAGRQKETIPIPALQVTSCTFGGSDMTTLYVTTANYQMTPVERERFPLAGSVFRLPTNTSGTTRRRVKLPAIPSLGGL